MADSDALSFDASSNGEFSGGAKSVAEARVGENIPAHAEEPQTQEALEGRTNVLVVDDHQTNIDLVQNYLSRMKLSSVSAHQGREAIELAKKLQPDLILLDVMMPGMNGLEVCRILKNDPCTSAIPIIFLSARSETDHKVRGIAMGAVDYITKPFDPSELEIRIRSVLRTKNLQDKLSAQARTDALTGLHNWRYFYEILSREVDRSGLSSDPLSLILADLDMFKVVNDCYGHQMGDRILYDLGAFIRRTARPTDYVARYGGDELAVVLPSTSLKDAKALADRLRESLSRVTFGNRDFTVEVACSVGVATLGLGDKASAGALVRMADEALYAAKRQGRNRVCIWRPADKDELLTEDSKVSHQLYQMRTQVASINAQSRKQAMESMWMLVKALEARDQYSAHHSENVMHYAVSIATKMGLAPEFVQHIRNAAILHDIGKIGVPDRVLKKIGRLSVAEWELMKQHPLISAEILGQLTVLKPEVLSVRHHHEHFDGSGYPEGLAGKQIPIGARILAVADAFDAITSDRIYRTAKDCQTAASEIVRCSKAQFDPEVVEAFARAAQAKKDSWPIRRHSRENFTFFDKQGDGLAGESGGLLADEQPADEWTNVQQKIEESLASLAESLDKLSASRSQQDIDSVEAALSQFQSQAEELSSLAKSVPQA